MRRVTGILAVLAVTALASACCGTNVKKADVSEARRLHTAYRSAVVPAEGLDAIKVNKLGTKIDSILQKMEELAED